MNRDAATRVDDVTRALTGEASMGGFAVSTKPWWKRLARRLFPVRWTQEPPGSNGIHFGTTICLGMSARLEVLLLGRISVRAFIQTEVDPGSTKVLDMAIYTELPKWLR